MKMMVILIVIGALGKVFLSLKRGQEELEIGGQIETIRTTTLLISTRILRRVLETWGDFNQTPVKDHQLSPVWKPRKEYFIIFLRESFFFFFTSALGDGLSLKSKWQQVSSSLWDSSQYFRRSLQCCSFVGLHSSSYFQVLLSLN